MRVSGVAANSGRVSCAHIPRKAVGGAAELQHMVTYEADGVREFLCLWKEDVKVLDGTEERHAKSGADAPSAPRAAHAVAGEAAEAPAAASGGAGGAGGASARADAEQSEDADAALLMGLQ